jgi:hypothetical protein
VTQLVQPSRRGLLAGAGAVTAGASLLAAEPAAAVTYTPRKYVGAPLLSSADRHLVSRFSYGITPQLAKQVRDQGGARAWFQRQLSPGSIGDASAEEINSWWPSLGYDAARLWARSKDGTETGWKWAQNYQRWLLNRRIRSNRHVSEVMTEFWENHLNVPTTGEAHFTFRKDYGEMIRRRALGTYEDLLFAAVTHPSMLIYLDNAISTAISPNENLGRELLELHSVGLGAGYTESDVKNSARILTGWRVNLDTWDTSYRPGDHWTGTVNVLGFSDPNTVKDGRDLTRRYVSYLARHPSTATSIARKLAIKFVQDDPPQGLVDTLASVYLSSGTDIVSVLEALVDSPEFAGSGGAKVRDPGEDLVATYRVLGIKVRKPDLTRSDRDKYAAHAMLWQAGSMGLIPFAWPRPDGAPITNQAWASPSRMIASFQTHYNVSGGWYPKLGITYRSRASWVPSYPMRLDVLVDYLSIMLLQRRSTSTLLQACCEAVDLPPSERIVRDHRLVKWDMPRLLTTLLDSPAHLTR